MRALHRMQSRSELLQVMYNLYYWNDSEGLYSQHEVNMFPVIRVVPHPQIQRESGLGTSDLLLLPFADDVVPLGPSGCDHQCALWQFAQSVKWPG